MQADESRQATEPLLVELIKPEDGTAADTGSPVGVLRPVRVTQVRQGEHTHLNGTPVLRRPELLGMQADSGSEPKQADVDDQPAPEEGGPGSAFKPQFSLQCPPLQQTPLSGLVVQMWLPKKPRQHQQRSCAQVCMCVSCSAHCGKQTIKMASLLDVQGAKQRLPLIPTTR